MNNQGNCLKCKKQLNYPNWRKPARKYCSFECSIGPKIRIEKNCPSCQSIMKLKPSELDVRKFCSKRCGYDSQKVNFDGFNEEFKDYIRNYIQQNIKKNENGCWIWQRGKISTGYGMIAYKRKKILAHRASYIAYRGDLPDNLIIAHTCDVAACLAPLHLFATSQKENSIDCSIKGRAKGLFPKGNKGPATLINEEKAREIKQYLIQGYGPNKTAELAKVSIHIAQDIARNRTWRHVQIEDSE